MPYQNLDMIASIVRGGGSGDALLTQGVLSVQESVRQLAKEGNMSREFLEKLLESERKGKKRTSLTRWIEFSLETSSIPGKYYLDFMGEVGIWKSALQKHIRRSEVDSTYASAKQLAIMQWNTLIRRVKVILCEDCYGSIDLYRFIESDPIGVACLASSRSKDGHCCRAFNEIKDTNAYKEGYDIDWISDNYIDGDFEKVVSMLFAMEESKELLLLKDIISTDLDNMETSSGWTIFEELTSNSKIDHKLTIVALLRMIRDGYEVIANAKTEMLEVKGKFENSDRASLTDVPWYAYDIHTFPGRVVKDTLAKHNGIDREDVAWMWWFGEASIRDRESDPTDTYSKYFMTAKEIKGAEDWKKIRNEAIDTVHKVVNDLFKISTSWK